MTKCSVDECIRDAKARGWCKAHWIRWKRHGSPQGGTTGKGIPLKFLMGLLSTKESNCIAWTFAQAGNGYGKVWYDGKWTFSHRVMCILKNGAPLDGNYQAAHLCGGGSSGCINPNHLAWKTPTQNVADTLSHGTRNHGSRNGMSILTENDVLWIRSNQSDGIKALAKKFSVSRAAISDVIRRRRWKHI